MKRTTVRVMRVAVGLASLMLLQAARAEVKVVAEHIDNDHAKPGFAFKHVPRPSKTDAGAKAKITVAAGVADPNVDVARLNDGELPEDQDAPDENFFFNEGTDGGRLLIDLGSLIEVKQVNTYSWHPNTRGPQVYTLYGAEGSAPGFVPAPVRDTDPEKVGWKRIAVVDTRPRKADGTVTDDDAAMGGQYGVSITDSAGAVGKYRYLLMVVQRTEDRDEWGNTFFSEIDVIDSAAAPTPATRPVPDVEKH